MKICDFLLLDTTCSRCHSSSSSSLLFIYRFFSIYFLLKALFFLFDFCIFLFLIVWVCFSIFHNIFLGFEFFFFISYLFCVVSKNFYTTLLQFCSCSFFYFCIIFYFVSLKKEIKKKMIVSRWKIKISYHILLSTWNFFVIIQR